MTNERCGRSCPRFVVPPDRSLSRDLKSSKAGSGVGLYGYFLKIQFVVVSGKHVLGNLAIGFGRVAQFLVGAGLYRDHSEWPLLVEVDADGRVLLGRKETD